MSDGRIVIEQTECEKCSEPLLFTALDEVDVLNVGIITLCDDCVDELVVCEDCDIRAKDSNDLIYIELYDKYVCDECLSNSYFQCDSCSEYTLNGDGHGVENDILCESCFDNQVVQCSWCDENVYESNSYNFYGETICESCENDYVICCNDCGDRLHVDDSSGGCCDNCYDNYDDGSCFTRCSGSLNYYRLDDEPSPRMYYGIELETGTLKHINFGDDIIRNLPIKYFDRHDDCSIFDDGNVKQGIEIVGHPMTYKWMKANPNIWNDVLKLRRKRLRSYKTGTCGIHIHLSKNAFNERHLYKFMKMIYGFPSFTKLISQRNGNRLKEWADIKGECKKDLKRKAKDKCGGKRYTAVNLTNSKGTVEIRLFRGTLNEMAFWKNIEYIQALLEFTANAKVKELSIKNYLSYVCVKKHEFCNLYNWLKKKGKIKEIKE